MWHIDIWHPDTANTIEWGDYMLNLFFWGTSNPMVLSWNHGTNNVAIRRCLESENPMLMQRGLAVKQKRSRTRI